jgi:hypothetical protein
MRERKPINLSTEVLTPNYRFFVETKTRYFAGDGFSMEDMPGWFMRQSIYLHGASRVEHDLILKMGKNIPLLLTQIPASSDKEITDEPRGYEQLKHRYLVLKVKERPFDYMNRERLIALLKK